MVEATAETAEETAADSRAPTGDTSQRPSGSALDLAELQRACVVHTGRNGQVVEAPVEVREPSHEDAPLDERPWVVIVWNDPINLMTT